MTSYAAIAFLAEAPMSYHQTFGPAVDPITKLGWGLGSVSVLVVLTIAALLIGAMFRKRVAVASERTLTVHRDSGGMSWIYVGVSISSVVLIGCVVWTMLVANAVSRPLNAPKVTVEVVASQWWWSVRYLDADPAKVFTTANEIHIPTGEPVRVELVSADVIHSFWIPQLAGKMDVIPGQTNISWLQADQPGSYRGQCAAFCGVQHAHMALAVIAQSPNDFAAWETNQLAETGPPSADVAEGQDIFRQRCAVCHTIRGVSPAGVRGPDLTHLMTRHTLAAGMLVNSPANLSHWIEDAQSVKTGVLMPKENLSRTQLTAVTAYLHTLN